MGPLRHSLRQMTFTKFGNFGRKALRTDNVSLPHLQTKVIFGRVESRNEDGFYTVNIGFKAPSVFHETELRRGIGTKLKEEPVPEIGDKLKLYVRYLQNPMGEMEVSNADRVRVERSEGSWREIKDHYRNGTHIKGRILNAVNGGYAVGIAGLVAFLPNQCVRPYRGDSVPPAGELLPFKILGLTEDIKNVILVGPMTGGNSKRDVAWAGKRGGGRRGGESNQSGSNASDGKSSSPGAFWKRKQKDEKDSGASTWVKLSGSDSMGKQSEKKETAPLEKSAEDGRPMWGKTGKGAEGGDADK